jgi:hypothetical protein
MTIGLSAIVSDVSIRGYGYVLRIRTRIRAIMFSTVTMAGLGWVNNWTHIHDYL